MADRQKRQQVFNWLKQKQVKIALLQETHSTVETEQLWRFDWGGDILFSHGSNAARGAAILFDKDLPIHIHSSLTDNEGRYIVLDMEINGLRLTLCNIYAPNEDRPEFFVNVIHHIESLTNDNRIISGDLNLVLDIEMDKKGGLRTTNTKSQQVVSSWMDDTDMVDIWRWHHPDDRKYTWHRLNPSKIFCRLDYFLVSYGLTEKIIQSKISPGFRSDHSAINLIFMPFANITGKGFWKLNCSHLYDLDFVNRIKNTIQLSAEINKEANPNLLWDTIKMSVRGESIKFGAQKKKEINCKIKTIEKDISVLQDLLSSTENPNHFDIAQQLEVKKEELNNIIKLKTQGAIIRSRVQYYDEGEKNSKYFFNLEKRNANIKSINRLELDSNITTEDPGVILKEMENFYKKLYTSVKTSDPNNFSRNLLHPEDIKQEHYTEMEKPLTDGEILKIIKSLPKNKTPGEDGLPSEFYQVFWIDIKQYLIDSYKYSYDTGELSLTQRRGILSLIPKKSNPLRLKNWRPISLLNQDYKILAKLIAERIKLCLSYIIDRDQSGFIKGRYIGQNITSLLDTLHYAEQNDISALLISVDYEKAFDKLEWKFIKHSLEYFNFPKTIIDWVDILYTNIQSCVINNGHQSPYFELQRGVRQGCPLSPYLFIIAAEIFSLSIRQNPHISGIKIGKKINKIKQYADDTQIITLFDARSFAEIVLTFDTFTDISGLTINYDKTEILRIGNIKNTDLTLPNTHTFKWTNNEIRVLGITIMTSSSEIIASNIEPLLVKINNISEIWSKRKLTLFGKTTIINTLLVSQLIYRLSVLPTPQLTSMKLIDNTLFSFLWGGKTHKIAKNYVTNTYENAGIKMVDIYKKDMSLKIAWVKRIAENPPYTICPIIDKYCKLPVHLLLRCNLAKHDVQFCFTKVIPSFWLHVFEYWCQYNYRKPENVTSYSNEIIWLNSNIKIGGKIAFNRAMVENNIIRIKDILNDNGLLYDIHELNNKYACNVNFVYYYGIINAIKKAYRIAVAPPDRQSRDNMDRIMGIEKVPKYIYNELISHNITFPEKAYRYHNDILDNSVSPETYREAFNAMYRSTYSNKLRDFQYRLLHNALVTNTQLHKWGMLGNNLCTFCGSCQESCIHLLLTCSHSKDIWDHVFQTIRHMSTVSITLTQQEIMLGVMGTSSLGQFYNHISMLVKQYIYACRCLNKVPNKYVIIEKIKDARHVEMIIATQRGKVNEHRAKWDPLSAL